MSIKVSELAVAIKKFVLKTNLPNVYRIEVELPTELCENTAKGALSPVTAFSYKSREDASVEVEKFLLNRIGIANTGMTGTSAISAIQLVDPLSEKFDYAAKVTVTIEDRIVFSEPERTSYANLKETYVVNVRIVEVDQHQRRQEILTSIIDNAFDPSVMLPNELEEVKKILMNGN